MKGVCYCFEGHSYQPTTVFKNLSVSFFLFFFFTFKKRQGHKKWTGKLWKEDCCRFSKKFDELLLRPGDAPMVVASDSGSNIHGVNAGAAFWRIGT